MGISQEELSEGLCSVSTLSRIENNQQNPTRSLTRQLLERLGLSRERFFALWDQEDIATEALTREIRRGMIHYRRALTADRPRIQEDIRAKLDELEGIVDPEDLSARQFLLSHQALLGGPEGPYGFEKRLSMQLEAIRLTCPRFDPEDIQRGHYSMAESALINQIAQTYSRFGQRKKAIDIYRQLLRNIEKNSKELAEYADYFCLIAHNYAIDLGMEKRYSESIEIAERGRRTCLYYGDYQFLPGFLAIQAECWYFMGDEEKSRRLYLQAYHIYEAFEDESSQEIMRKEMKEHLSMVLPK